MKNGICAISEAGQNMYDSLFKNIRGKSTIKLHMLYRQQYKKSLSIQAALKKLEVQNNKPDSSTTGCTLKSSLRSL